jgi:hypothetical protein
LKLELTVRDGFCARAVVFKRTEALYSQQFRHRAVARVNTSAIFSYVETGKQLNTSTSLLLLGPYLKVRGYCETGNFDFFFSFKKPSLPCFVLRFLTISICADTGHISRVGIGKPRGFLPIRKKMRGGSSSSNHHWMA